MRHATLGDRIHTLSDGNPLKKPVLEHPSSVARKSKGVVRVSASEALPDGRRTLAGVQDDRAGTAARLEDVHEDGHVSFEVTATARKRPDVTSVFSVRANADLVYTLACHGVTDLSTPVIDLPRAWWREHGNRELADRCLVAGFTNGPEAPRKVFNGYPACRCQRSCCPTCSPRAARGATG